MKSAKLGEVERGRELVFLETTHEWVHVMAMLGEEKTVTGWILDKGVVRATSQDGDRILFGEGTDSEDQASRRRGRRGAADDAARLYYRVYDLYPASPYAGEALYRAADIRWQVEKIDVMSRPSAREKESYLRQGMNEELMKTVIKKYPGTKWADLAAFQLIENKLCGDWQGSVKCPDKEAETYEKMCGRPATVSQSGRSSVQRGMAARGDDRHVSNRRAAEKVGGVQSEDSRTDPENSQLNFRPGRLGSARASPGVCRQAGCSDVRECDSVRELLATRFWLECWFLAWILF